VGRTLQTRAHRDGEAAANWNKWIRQFHRWMAVIFTSVVAAIFAMFGVGQQPAQWVYYLPLPPLLLLLFSGAICLPCLCGQPCTAAAVAADSQEIDARLAAMDDWRGAALALLALFTRRRSSRRSNGATVRPVRAFRRCCGGILCTGKSTKAKSS
jgi:hypothetical protein